MLKSHPVRVFQVYVGVFFSSFPNKALLPLTLRLAEKVPTKCPSSRHTSRAAPDSGVQSQPGQGNLWALILNPRRPRQERKAAQGNLPGGQSGTTGGLAVPSRDLTRSEKKPPPLLSTRTRRLPGPGLGLGLPHVPCSPLPGPAQLLGKTGRPHPAGADPGGCPRRTGSSEPRPERPQLPAAAPARAPCTAAAPETAPRRGSAGGTWCRRRGPPCPARAVLAAAPPAGPPLYLTVSGTTWRRRPARGLRRAGGRARAGAGAGSPVLRGRSLARVDVDHAGGDGAWSSRRL